MKPTEPPSSHLLNLWATWLWASCISQGFIQDDVYKNLLVICFALVLMCQDPGNVAHSHRILTGSRFTVGSTVQFICNKGYILSGNSLLTCYNRNSATPKWSESLPKCVRKSYKSSSEFNCCTHCKNNTTEHRILPGSGLWQYFWCFQLRSMSRAETLVQPPPVCRTLKRPFTKQEKRWPSPVTLATSCRVRPPSTVFLGTLHSGIVLLLPAEVRASS